MREDKLEKMIAAALPEARDEVRQYVEKYPPELKAESSMDGYVGLSFDTGEIWLLDSQSPRDMLLTFAHEVAHQVLQRRGFDADHDEIFCSICWKLQIKWTGERDKNESYDLQDAGMSVSTATYQIDRHARRAAGSISPEAEASHWHGFHQEGVMQEKMRGLLVIIAALVVVALLLWMPKIIAAGGEYAALLIDGEGWRWLVPLLPAIAFLWAFRSRN